MLGSDRPSRPNRTEVFKARTNAAQCVRRHLRRRASASRRIGVAYIDVSQPAAAPGPAPPPIERTTKLGKYRWVDGFDGWVEDVDDAILAVRPARGSVPDGRLLKHVRLSPTTRAWGLYANGENVPGRNLYISEWWAGYAIALQQADGAHGSQSVPDC